MRKRYLIAVAVLAASASGIFTHDIAQAGFPGINGRIAFHSNRDGDYEIYTMKSDGTDVVQLTHNSSIDSDVAWSSDGTKLTFQSDRDGNYEVYTMNADGSNQVRVTNNPATDINPTWAPGGAKIGFTTNRDGNNEVYTVNPDGSSPLNITNDAGNQVHRDFSYDGTQMAFQQLTTIRIMNSNGTGQTLVSSGNNPNWAPDATKLVFNHDFAGGQGQEVYYINPNGTGLTQVTASAGTNVTAAWSPDGSKIIFRSTRDVDNEIYSINTDGSGEVRLTNNVADDNLPDWQPLTIPPVATNDSVTAASGEATVLDVLDNDTDTYGTPNPASVTITSAASHGSTSINLSTGAITYTAAAGYAGSDSLTYRVCSSESLLLCDTAVLGISVTPGLPVTGARTPGPSPFLIITGVLITISGVLLTSRRSVR